MVPRGLLLLALALVPACCYGGAPFWLSRTCYVEGAWLYCSGSAPSGQTQQESSSAALDAARASLREFLQLSDVSSLSLSMQEVYAPQEGREYAVLTRTPYDKAQALRSAVQADSERRLKRLETAQTQELGRKERSLERLRAAEERLKELEEEFNEIHSRITEISERAHVYISAGMTYAEVKRLMGEPAVRESVADRLFLNYGQYWVVLQSGVVACLLNAADFRGKESNCDRRQLKVTKPSFTLEDSMSNYGVRRRHSPAAGGQQSPGAFWP